MENIKNIDLSNSKWTPENELYLLSVSEGIIENYPNIDLEKELNDAGYIIEDLIQPDKIKIFMTRLQEKYPDLWYLLSGIKNRDGELLQHTRCTRKF